ncbi:MAG: hypothetical protein GY755_07735 [Chloroflexi bacterium]|nr:hypothetical protein [Chloroflexota bacterium]
MEKYLFLPLPAYLILLVQNFYLIKQELNQLGLIENANITLNISLQSIHSFKNYELWIEVLSLPKMYLIKEQLSYLNFTIELHYHDKKYCYNEYVKLLTNDQILKNSTNKKYENIKEIFEKHKNINSNNINILHLENILSDLFGKHSQYPKILTNQFKNDYPNVNTINLQEFLILTSRKCINVIVIKLQSELDLSKKFKLSYYYTYAKIPIQIENNILLYDEIDYKISLKELTQMTESNSIGLRNYCDIGIKVGDYNGTNDIPIDLWFYLHFIRKINNEKYKLNIECKIKLSNKSWIIKTNHIIFNKKNKWKSKKFYLTNEKRNKINISKYLLKKTNKLLNVNLCIKMQKQK